MLEPSTVYLNGEFMSNDRASISPDDRGFYFADGIYEVIKFYKNKPFYFGAHLERLNYGLNELKIEFGDTKHLMHVCQALIDINGFKQKHAGVYIQITRGAAPRTHRFPDKHIKPTIFARAFPMPPYIREMSAGVNVRTHEDIRWLRCNIKTIALLPNTLLFEEVASHGAFECVFVRNGFITEASHSNIFAVDEGIVCTHHDSNLILPGITKAAVLDLCRELKITFREEPIHASQINKYQEWFITGTGSEIVPVVKMDDMVIGNGKPGIITRKLQEAFLKKTYEELAGEKIMLQD